MEFNDDDNHRFNIVDQKKSGISIVIEENGNHALYFKKPADDENQTEENYFSAKGWDTERVQDLYLSFDMKMGGDVIAAGDLITFVIRPGYAELCDSIVKVTAGGGIYLSGKHLGQLSKDVYTRIAVATDRINNKYYVYINDVLANPEGAVLFSDADIKAYNDKYATDAYTYSATSLPLDDIRVYRVGKEFTSATRHDGVYFDNLTIGKRFAVRNRDITESLLVQSDFSAATHGDNVFPENSKPTSVFGTGYGKFGGAINPDSVVYVDESVVEDKNGDGKIDAADGDGTVDAIKFTTAAASGGQTFVQVSISSDKNVSFQMDVKMGPEGIKGSSGLLWHDITPGSNTNRPQLDIIGVDNNGNVKWNSNNVITTLSKTEYTTIKVDIITTGPVTKSALYLIYVGKPGEELDLKFVGYRDTSIVSDSMFIRNFRIYHQYSGDNVALLKPDDLHIKNIVVSHTDDYNYLGNNSTVPFAKHPSGFITLDGITRYYDGNGGYATEDFFIGSNKYMVGNDGEILSMTSGVLPERSVSDIQKEFAKQRVELRFYQAFENTGLLTGEATEYKYPETGTGNEAMRGELDYKGSGALINHKNYRGSYTLVTEADGNKALLFHNSAKKYTTNADNKTVEDNSDTYLDLLSGLPNSYSHMAGASHDLFVSIDLKMGGANVQQASVFAFVNRPYNSEGGKVMQAMNHIFIDRVGGIYLDDSCNPDKRVGFLSRDGYTRIAVATDRANNKLYVYINDVLVTPDGITLFSDSFITRSNQYDATYGKFTPATVPIHEIRTYNSSGHDNVNEHKGLYIDNILYGARLVTTGKTTAPISSATLSFDKTWPEGATVPAVGGGFDPTHYGTGNIIATVGNSIDGKEHTVRYVDENNDGKPDAIEWHKIAKENYNVSSGEAYLQMDNSAAKGTNLRFTVKVKGGIDGQTESGEFLMFRTYPHNGLSGNRNEVVLKLTDDGTLKTHNNFAFAKLTNDKYIDLTVDFICNAYTGNANYVLYYVDGILKATEKLVIPYSDTATGNSGGYSETDYHPSIVRIYSIYKSQGTLKDTDGVLKLEDKDLRINYISYGSTSDYDTVLGRISVFESKPAGLHGIGGVYRYYNGDGTYATETFTDASGVKYVIGFNGSVRIDSHEYAPYAPYVD